MGATLAFNGSIQSANLKRHDGIPKEQSVTLVGSVKQSENNANAQKTAAQTKVVYVKKLVLIAQLFILVSHAKILIVGQLSHISLLKQLIQTVKRRKMTRLSWR